jgi:Cu/Ag efflux protein CusF
MRKHVLFATAAALALAFALPVLAGEKAEKTDKPEKPKKRQYTGVIESIDVEKCTVVLKKKDETKTFSCTADCKYKAGEKEGATLADFKVGDKVLVTYTEEDGKLICSKMGPPPPKKEKKEAEAK